MRSSFDVPVRSARRKMCPLSNPTVSLVGITSNQGQNALGDGNTSTDIVIDNGHIFLRAERTGTSKEDRIYTITYMARDATGNIGTGTATVTVPHDQRN